MEEERRRTDAVPYEQADEIDEDGEEQEEEAGGAALATEALTGELEQLHSDT